ncbi:MAG: nucleoside phosphorylase [Planctomycetes bacterium]|nr:nucleoside phosphorylase [Planctomycetota bacterium]
MPWQWFAKQWLRQQAEAAVRQRFAEAMQEQAAAAADGEQPPPAHCHVGIVFALGIEAGGLIDLLGATHTTHGDGFKVRTGTLAGRQLALVEAGVGPRAAERGTRALLMGHRPDWVISAGFSGALQASAKRGDIVLAQNIVTTDGARLNIDLKVDADWLARTPGCHAGQILMTDQVVATPADKRALGERHQALCVDMESFVVAEVCRQARQRCLAVRVISDTVDDALPADVAQLASCKTGARRAGAALAALWRRPGAGKDMLRLQQQAIEASDRLATFLASFIPALVLLAEVAPTDAEQ